MELFKHCKCNEMRNYGNIIHLQTKKTLVVSYEVISTITFLISKEKQIKLVEFHLNSICNKQEPVSTIYIVCLSQFENINIVCCEMKYLSKNLKYIIT